MTKEAKAAEVLAEIINNPSLIDWVTEHAADGERDCVKLWEAIKRARELINKE